MFYYKGYHRFNGLRSGQELKVSLVVSGHDERVLVASLVLSMSGVVLAKTDNGETGKHGRIKEVILVVVCGSIFCGLVFGIYSLNSFK